MLTLRHGEVDFTLTLNNEKGNHIIMWPLLYKHDMAEVRIPYPKSPTKNTAHGNSEGVLDPTAIALG